MVPRTVPYGLAGKPAAPAAARARLADDPSKRVRLALACGPAVCRGWPERLPDRAYERLFRDPYPVIRGEALRAPSVPASVLARLAGHLDAELRHAACRAWHALTPGARQALLADADPGVRKAAVSPHPTPDVVALLAQDDDFAVRLVLGAMGLAHHSPSAA
ncbi:hypothetical protein IPZ58_36390 [Streptomyces roseoverticillatus]|uniref:hypothetical protein n=1 Tax=Streptomyces roseoverticillatus TaxID=66429 RepID=UPI001F2CD7D0|nr:hypothetical protein [Streptomyces roseoverticillatus]MCF3106995.1 hypothetical protein [Streptomyces roseoverticillatus]